MSHEASIPLAQFISQLRASDDDEDRELTEEEIEEAAKFEDCLSCRNFLVKECEEACDICFSGEMFEPIPDEDELDFNREELYLDEAPEFDASTDAYYGL